MQGRTGENSTSNKEGSPTWLAVAAVASLGVILLIAGLSLVRLGDPSEGPHPDEETVANTIPEVPKSIPRSSPQQPLDADWRAHLYASECPAPCAAGPLCATTDENTLRSDYCSANEVHCDECSSKMKCIPGEPSLELARGEQWNLRLSDLRLIRKADDLRKTQPRPCEYERSYWVCLRPMRLSETWTCLGLDDACSHGNKSNAFLTVSTEDLIESGFEVEVRYSREDGPLLLPRSLQRFEKGMKRRGLCNGFKRDLGETRTHEIEFTFFLEPAD